MSHDDARLLVIDADEQNREWAAALFQPEGYRVEFASTGAEALDRLGTTPSDLILLDVMIPGAIDGIDLAARIKADADLRNIPIIVLTSAVDDETRLDTLEVGAEEFLSRPVRPAELVRRVRNLVRLKRIADDLRVQNARLHGLESEASLAVEQERSLRDTLDALHAPIAILDTVDMVVQTNAAWDLAARPSGAAGGEYLASDVELGIEAGQDLLEGVQRVRVGELDRYSQVYRAADERWFLASATRFRDDGNHVVLCHLDITEQKELELRHAAREAEYETVLSTIPATIFRLDRDSNIEFLNRAFPGHEESSIGLPLFGYLEPEDVEVMRGTIQGVFESRASGFCRVRIGAPSGELRHLEVSFAPIEVDDRVTGVIGIAFDITARGRAEAEKNAMVERLQLVLDSLPVASFVGSIDEQRPHVSWMSDNVERVTKVSTEKWETGTWLQYVNERELEPLLARLRELETDGRFNTQVDLRGEDDSVRTFAVQCRMSSGRISAVALDVTEQHLLERRLVESQKLEAIGQLAGGVAHDFNNLLMVIMAFASCVRDALPPGGESHEDIEEVLTAASKAASLTRQLLLFSRHTSVSLSEVDLNASLVEISRLLSRTLGEHIQVETHLCESPAVVFADASQIDQLLMNLAVNARDAMPDGGVLTIAVDFADVHGHPALDPGLHVRLRVSDTGVGMPEEVSARIFEPFFTTKGTSGTGLGLATCYGVATAFGGTIDVESAVGHGTTFTIHLPAADVLKLREDTAPRTDELMGLEHVLVVEDEPALRRVARRTLESKGYQVSLAGDAVEAQSILEAHPDSIDVLFSDVVLPKGNGYELAEWVTEHRPEIVVLLTSGYPDRATPGEDGDRFPIFWKPYAPVELLQRLRSILDTPSTEVDISTGELNE